MLRIITESKLQQIVDDCVEKKLNEVQQTQMNELAEKQVRIAMLQNQINPHFLYNALDCIRGQALMIGAPEIAEITRALSEYFRYSVSLRDNIVTIASEISNVANYVTIQKYRFGNRFSLDIDIDPDDPVLRVQALPKLTLQPLVENAILHAFTDSSRNDCTVRLSAHYTQNHVCILVTDNGVGMSRTVHQKILASLDDEEIVNERSGHGIALGNVHRRIALVFGREYGLNISSVENVGTEIEIFIPRRTVEDFHEYNHV